MDSMIGHPPSEKKHTRFISMNSVDGVSLIHHHKTQRRTAFGTVESQVHVYNDGSAWYPLLHWEDLQPFLGEQQALLLRVSASATALHTNSDMTEHIVNPK